MRQVRASNSHLRMVLKVKTAYQLHPQFIRNANSLAPSRTTESGTPGRTPDGSDACLSPQV